MSYILVYTHAIGDATKYTITDLKGSSMAKAIALLLRLRCVSKSPYVIP